MKKVLAFIVGILFATVLVYTCTKDDKDAGKTKTVDTAVRSAQSSSMTTSNPISYSGRSGVTITGLSIQAGSGPAISLTNCNGITITKCLIQNGTGVKAVGILLNNCKNITIIDNIIENVASGVYALNCTGGIVVQNNQMQNMTGPYPRGQFVQLDKASGAGNKISGNKLENIMGASYPEDAISLYESNGTSASPIVVSGNDIRGGGPSKTGGGIMLGDGGGSYQQALNNMLVNPGQYGIAVASGNNMTISGNKVFAVKNTFTNTGIYVWNQYSTTCGTITVTNNLVNYTNSAGQSNGFWNGGNCGPLVESGNNFADKAVSAGIVPAVLITGQF